MRCCLLVLCSGCAQPSTWFVLTTGVPQEQMLEPVRLTVQFDGTNVAMIDYCETLPGTGAVIATEWREGRCTTPAEVAVFLEPVSPCEPFDEPLDAQPTSAPRLTWAPDGSEACLPMDDVTTGDPTAPEPGTPAFSITVALPDIE